MIPGSRRRAEAERSIDRPDIYAAGPATVIQADLTIAGDLTTDGAIVIEGTVIGTVNGREVTVRECGQVEGMILAEAAFIEGVVVGPIQANSVTLFTSAHVVGNVFHHELTVQPGATIEGRRPWRPHIDRKQVPA
jgi:cytoskeletal protein CcmA (bactofilin family)